VLQATCGGTFTKIRSPEVAVPQPKGSSKTKGNKRERLQASTLDAFVTGNVSRETPTDSANSSAIVIDDSSEDDAIDLT
jgi:hypothetical protein